jgi:hypothetical protein
MRESPTLSVRTTRAPRNIGRGRLIFLVCEGGNSLDKAPLGTVHDFVKDHGGHSVITKVRSTHFELFGDGGVPLGTRVRRETVSHYVSYDILDTTKLQRISSYRVSDPADLLCASYFLIRWVTDYVLFYRS